MTILPVRWRRARLALPCLALPCLALPRLALPRLALRDRRGASAVEFALVCPVFLLLLFGIIGYGVTGLIQLTLDDAVRDAARQLQMDTPAATSASGFVAAVCGEFGVVASDCSKALTYNVQAATQAKGFASLAPAKLSASGALANNFFGGTAFAANTDVLVQVAYPMPFSIPFLGTLATMTGTNSLLATASVRVEPFPS